MPKLLDLTGERFGRLVVLSMSEVKKSGKVHWNCVCDCGKLAVCVSGNLRNGGSTSCGCFRIERITEERFIHGRNSKDPTYGTWMAMKMRCTNTSSDHYQYYGARGIKVCERWSNFMLFLEDMGERPDGMTIDRINSDGDYEPGNCKWSTDIEQANNKRNSRVLEMDGISMTVSEWGRKLDVPSKVIFRRIYKGWDAKEALTTPIKKED